MEVLRVRRGAEVGDGKTKPTEVRGHIKDADSHSAAERTCHQLPPHVASILAFTFLDDDPVKIHALFSLS